MKKLLSIFCFLITIAAFSHINEGFENSIPASGISPKILNEDCENPQAFFDVIADCEISQQFTIAVDLTDLGSNDDVVISDDQGSSSQTASSTGVYTFGPYDNGTNVIIHIENSQNPDCAINSPSLTKHYCPELAVDCGQGPVNSVICYQSGENIEVTYTSSDPSQVLDLSFNSTMLPTNGEDFKVFDSNGNELYSGTGDDGDMSNVTVQSTGDELSISYFANFNCGLFNYTALDIEVACSECVNPQATFTPVNDCNNDNDIYNVDVEVTDFGTAQTIEVADNQGSTPQTLSQPGVVTFGPYPYDNYVDITVADADDPSCSFTTEVIQNLCRVIGDADTYTDEELVTDVLFDNPCAQVSNITSITGTDFNDVDGIGHFTTDPGVFPLESGLVLSTGAVDNIKGPLTNENGDGTNAWLGDDDIDDLIHEIEGNDDFDSNNASVLEFDFVPINDHISFDYLLASNEYGLFQCRYTDAFAFFLTDEDGNTQNLAVVPGTDTPVTVRTIRDGAYNDVCESQNAEYFDTYYGEPNGLPLEFDPTNFHGNTVKLTAGADVVPGQTYHIKLAIGDRGDTGYDSAVFLKAGSFDLGEIDLGEDLTIENGNAPCETEEVVLDSGIDDTSFVDFSWYKGDALLEGEEETTLNVTEPGTYIVVAVYGGSCVVSDEITVEFAPFPEFDFDGDNDYSLCGTDSVILDGTPSNSDSLVGDLSYTWYMGEDEIAGETDSTLEVNEPGTYTVQVESEEGCTASHTFDVTEASFTIDLGEDQTLCDQESYELTAEITDEDPANATFDWEGPNGPIAETTQTISVSETGTYTVNVGIDGCTASDDVNLDFNGSPDVDLGEDITTCGLVDMILDATPSNYDADEVTFEWDYNGNPIAETDATINPGDHGYGTYTVTVYADDPNCDTQQSITIEEIDDFGVELTADDELTKELNYCDGDPELPVYEVTLTASLSNAPADEVIGLIWYKNGEELSDVNGEAYTVTYDTEGDHGDEYTVEATLGSCNAVSSVATAITIVPYEHPCEITEGLSPGNNDGINDCLDLSFVDDRSGIANFKVFNRYGVKVYEESNYSDQWCGQDDDGDELTTGTYYYVLEMKNDDPVFGRSKRGWIYINRKSN